MAAGPTEGAVEAPRDVRFDEQGTELQERRPTPQERAAASRQNQQATEQYGVLPAHPQQRRLNEIRERLDSNDFDDMSDAEVEALKAERDKIVETINNFTTSNYEQISEAFMRIAKSYADASSAAGIPEQVYGGFEFATRTHQYGLQEGLPGSSNEAATPLENGGGKPLIAEAVREIIKEMNKDSAHSPKSSKGQLVVAIFSGLASLGALAFAGLNRMHLDEVQEHTASAAVNSVDRDKEQPFVPDIQRDGLPLGSVKITVVTTKERDDLNPGSLMFVDVRGNRLDVLEAEGGPGMAAGKWTTFSTETEAGVEFTPDNPESFLSPFPVIYMMRNWDEVPSFPGLISLSYAISKDGTAPVLAQPIQRVEDFGTVRFDLGAALGKDVDFNTINFKFDDTVKTNPFTVEGEGTWSFDTTGGILTFVPSDGLKKNPNPISYAIGNAGDVLFADITLKYTDFEVANGALGKGPIAKNDVITEFDLQKNLPSADGRSVKGIEIDVLGNDIGVGDLAIKPSSVLLTTTLISADQDIPEIVHGEPVRDANDNVLGFKSIKIVGQGTWRVTPSGNIQFLPEDDFKGPPFAVYYKVANENDVYSNTASVILSEGLGIFQNGVIEITNAENDAFWPAYRNLLIDADPKVDEDVVYAATELLEASLFNLFAPNTMANARAARIVDIPSDEILLPWQLGDDPKVLFDLVSAYVDGLAPGLAKHSRVARYVQLNLLKRCMRLRISALQSMADADGRT